MIGRASFVGLSVFGLSALMAGCGVGADTSISSAHTDPDPHTSDVEVDGRLIDGEICVEARSASSGMNTGLLCYPRQNYLLGLASHRVVSGGETSGVLLQAEVDVAVLSVEQQGEALTWVQRGLGVYVFTEWVLDARPLTVLIDAAGRELECDVGVITNCVPLP